MSTGTLTNDQRAYMLGYLSSVIDGVGSIDREAWQRALDFAMHGALDFAVRESGGSES